MKLDVTSIAPRVVLVSPAAESLDINTSPGFRTAMAGLLADNTVVLLNMAPLGFVDSTGLGALLSALRTLKEKQGELRLFALTKPVDALFHLVRMHRVFPIFTTREDALKGLPENNA